MEDDKTIDINGLKIIGELEKSEEPTEEFSVMLITAPIKDIVSYLKTLPKDVVKKLSSKPLKYYQIKFYDSYEDKKSVGETIYDASIMLKNTFFIFSADDTLTYKSLVYGASTKYLFIAKTQLTAEGLNYLFNLMIKAPGPTWMGNFEKCISKYSTDKELPIIYHN